MSWNILFASCLLDFKSEVIKRENGYICIHIAKFHHFLLIYLKTFMKINS